MFGAMFWILALSLTGVFLYNLGSSMPRFVGIPLACSISSLFLSHMWCSCMNPGIAFARPMSKETLTAIQSEEQRQLQEHRRLNYRAMQTLAEGRDADDDEEGKEEDDDGGSNGTLDDVSAHRGARRAGTHSRERARHTKIIADILSAEPSSPSAASKAGPEKVCMPCSGIVPLDAHHCTDCGVCYLGWDHHCPWVGTCIGEGNQLPFYIFLSSLAATSISLSLGAFFAALASLPLSPPAGSGSQHL